MKRTENLNLPIYDNPESDIFKINDVNSAHETIDKQYKELKNIKETVESTNPSANLQGQINDINASLDKIQQELSLNSKNRYNEVLVARHSNVYSKLYSKKAIKSLVGGDSISQGAGSTTGQKSWWYRFGEKVGLKLNGVADWNSIPDNVGQGGKNICNFINHISYDYFTDRDGVLTTKKSYPYTGYDLWFLMTGVNDCNPSSNVGISLKDFELFYRMAVRMARNNGIDVICCTEPPYVNPSNGEIDSTLEERYNPYAEIIRNIASTEGCSLLDLQKEWHYMKELDGVNLATLTSDGTHPNDAGHEVISELAYKLIFTQPTTNIINNSNLSREYNLVPQLLTSNPIAGTFTQEDITTVAYTSYFKRTSNNKAIKVTNGNNIMYQVHSVHLDFIFVNVVEKLTTGTITVQSPSGKTIGTITSQGTLQMEKTFIFKSDETIKANTYIKLSVTGGDAYISSVGTIGTMSSLTHYGAVAEKVGDWTNYSMSSEKNYFLQSSTTNDYLKIRWFGEAIVFNFLIGNNCGKFSVQTDGGNIEEFDTYYNSVNPTDASTKSQSGFSSGWHTTIIKVLGTKNDLSSGTNIIIGRIQIYDIFHNQGVIVAQIGATSKLRLNSNGGFISTNIPYTISNDIVTVNQDAIIEIKNI